MLTGEALIRVLSSDIRRLRLSAGMTVKQAAARGGLHPRLWQKFEAGSSMNVQTLAKVCVGLGVSVTELLEEAPTESAGREQRARKSSASGSRRTSNGSGARAISRSSKPRTPRRSTADTGTS